MKTRHWIAALAFMSLCHLSSAAVKPGENIALNGNLEAEQQAYPMFWSLPEEGCTFSHTAGPGATGAYIFDTDSKTPKNVCIRQQDLFLPKDETFKMSVMVKTKNFKSNHCGFIIHNNGWYSEQGIRKLPENTDGWVLLEETFKLEKSSNGWYGLALFAINFTGHAEFAKLKLEAISPKALELSSVSSALGVQLKPKLIPLSPLLNHIPQENPVLTLSFYGYLQKTLDNYETLFSIDNGKSVKLPLQRLIKLNLAGTALGDHKLNVAVKDKDTEEIITLHTFNITIVSKPQIGNFTGKILNNFATNLIDQTVNEDNSSVQFINPKDGWVFISVTPNAPSPNLAVTLDSGDNVITHNTPRFEAFRKLDMGKHSISVSNAAKGAHIIINSIIEIFNYPLCANSQVPQNGKYDWDFHEKYVFPAVTTLNGGACSEENRPKLKEKGLLWLANLGTTNLKNPQDLIDRLTKAAGMTQPWYDGLTCDEQFFARPSLSFYTEGLWKFPNPDNKLIYTWIVGKPTLPGIHSDFISASLNASKGRGRLIFEAYCHSRPTEENAKEYLNDRLVDTMKAFNNFYPNAVKGSGMLLGNFNQIPIISLDVNPEVDYKYYLDMQLNVLANHKEFAGLATTGYWGSYYDDEELYRWSFKLLRHYCVEGNKTMLSLAPKYNYKYKPGFLQNCDFIDDMKSWDVKPAADKAITTAKFSGYGNGSQNRWGAGKGVGDTFCVFTRQPGNPNTITQTAKGLTPGKIYTLQFITADYNDMKAGKIAPRELGVTAILGKGAEVIPEKSYVFVDRRNSARKKDDGKVRINLNHIRFKATAPSFTVTFTDQNAKPGESIALNYIMMKPYFEN